MDTMSRKEIAKELYKAQKKRLAKIKEQEELEKPSEQAILIFQTKPYYLVKN